MSDSLLQSPIIDRRRWMVWVWMTFTVALAAWQFVFVVRLISNPELLMAPSEETHRYLRMVYYENFTLILSLILGGSALFVLLRKERQKAIIQQEFFATFTHEIKTSIAGIKLRLEGLQKDNSKDLSFSSRELLITDLSKLEVQLENSLILARGSNDLMLKENVSARDLLLALGPQSDLQIELKKNFTIQGDRRALEIIFKNIVLNSILHGGAENLVIEVRRSPDQLGLLQIDIQDDGKGPEGNIDKLGTLFYRPSSRSGNGIGLYLIKTLSEKLGGRAEFSKATPHGFRIVLLLPGEM